jgi:signal transduction histidine kinase
MSLIDLAQHLRQSREALVDRWLKTVLTTAHKAPAASGLDRVQLRNHIPTLLKEIEATLVGEATPKVEAEARDHGTVRWEDGFIIDEMIWELSALRLVLLDEIERYVGAEGSLTPVEVVVASKRIVDVIDRTARASAGQFVTATLAQRHEIEAKLEQRTQDLVADDHRKDAFLALLAHELRNPLAAISNALRLLRDGRSGEERRERALDAIDRQVPHQGRLVDDLMDVSRITREKIELRREAMDLVTLAREMVEDHQGAVKEARLTLALELPDDPVPVQGDRIRLAQVLGNLLTNAIKFTDPGGQIGVKVAVERDGQTAIIAVRDTGIGIEPAMLPRVFDPFAQAERSLARSQGGLGLGLALVKALVELHGGEVRVSSDGVGRGTEFALRLPIAPISSPPSVTPKRA